MNGRLLLSLARLMTVLAAVAFAVSGCYIVSLHPIAAGADRCTDPALSATWTTGTDTLTFSGDGIDNLKLAVIEPADSKHQARRSGVLDLTLTTIAGRGYMSLKPTSLPKDQLTTLEEMYFVPLFGISRYRIQGDTLFLEGLNFKEFQDRLKNHKLKGLEAEELSDNGPILITSSTAKLRKFFARRAEEWNLFDEPTAYVRVK